MTFVSVGSRPRFWVRVLTGLVGLMVVLGSVGMAVSLALRSGHQLMDFTGGLYDAGRAILHGVTPYKAHFLAHQAAIMRRGGIAWGETFRYPFSIPVYPAAANVAVVPLGLLPLWLAGALYTIVSVAAMVCGIRLLGVRDWRCHCVVLISWPFLYGVALGAIGPFLVLGAGVAWRWRDRLWPPALAIASIVAIKIFPWTLGAWLLLTRRYRTLALSVATCLGITVGAWAIIGFHGLAQYPQMLSEMSFLQEGRADSLVAVLLFAGISSGFASPLAAAVGLGLLALAWRVARSEGGDRRAFGLVVIAALTATPIVWEHYMVFLFIPIALITPRYSRLWLAPAVLPLLIVLSRLVVAESTKLQASSPDVLRDTLPYLALQVVLVIRLCTTRERRDELSALLRHGARLGVVRRDDAVPATSTS